MAATCIISIHINKGKIARQCIGERLDYIMNPKKTDGGILVSTYACSPETAADEFMLFRQEYQQNTGRTQENEVIGYHVRQAFKPDEITPEEANEIGKELASRMTDDQFAYVVATHIDKHHIHNHIIICSTDLEGQHKYRDVKQFITAIFTGMRVGELIGLEWNCVDLVNGCIHVNKQLVQTRKKGQDYKFGSLKNGKTRTITPAKYVIDILTDHKIDQEIEKARAKDLWNPGNFPNLVFTHPDGSHLSQPTVWKEFQKILQAAGLEHYRVHDLRHTFAVNSIMAGDDIKTLQENMGHYSAAFTLDRYGHVTETMKKASANRMQVFIEQLQEA